MRPDLLGTAVVFDLDGTLVDTAADLAAAMNHALAAAGFAPVPADRVRHLVGHGAKAMLGKAFAERGASPTPGETDRHLAIFLKHYMAHIADQSRAFPDAVSIIGELRRAGAKITICTNKREASARLLIEKLGLRELFDQTPADELGPVLGRDMLAQRRPGFGVEQRHGLVSRPDVEDRLRNGDRGLGRDQHAILGPQDWPIVDRVGKRQLDSRTAGSF